MSGRGFGVTPTPSSGHGVIMRYQYISIAVDPTRSCDPSKCSEQSHYGGSLIHYIVKMSIDFELLAKIDFIDYI